MPDISTLVPDIQKVLLTPQGKETADKIALEVAANIGHRLRRALNREERPRKPGVLFPSELGHPCHRKTWYEFNSTGKPEIIGPATTLKFTYGDMIEGLIIPLAEAAGHEITMVNHKLEYEIPAREGWSVNGRIDMVVDGHVVDVKSMAARSFDRWAQDGIGADTFGYSAQVQAYKLVSGEITKPGYILAVDKEGGKLALVETSRPDVTRLAIAKVDAACSLVPPSNRILPVPDGKSGNMKLSMYCSYCKYKEECWQDANGGKGLRKFNYSFGPVWLTEVKREPRVEEDK